MDFYIQPNYQSSINVKIKISANKLTLKNLTSNTRFFRKLLEDVLLKNKKVKQERTRHKILETGNPTQGGRPRGFLGGWWC